MPSTDLARFRLRTWLTVGTTVAAIATAGSLYLSLGLGLIPCTLCWYQRILMYPLVIILGVSALEIRPTVYRTAAPIVIAGTLTAAYHSWLQQSITATCSFSESSCAAIQYRTPLFGATIPNLSLIAFILILLVLLGVYRESITFGIVEDRVFSERG